MREEVNFKLEGKEWVELQNKAFEKLNKKANIDGFRPGKAPRDIFEKKYGKQEIILEAADEATNKEYKRLLGENKIIPIIEPKVELIKCDSDTLEVKFTFITDPEVTLGEYTNLKVKKEKAKVTKEEVDNSIKELLNEYAEVVVKEGNVESGDIAIIDFAGYKDGVAFEGGTSENYSLTIGSNTFIPGFEDQIIGMKVDEEKDINVKFPEEYFSKDLAGKDATFKVKLHEIKKKELPKLDDEFAKDVSEFDTLEELKNSIKEKIQTENDSRAKYELEENAIKTVCENTPIDIPSAMIENEIENMMQDIKVRLSYQGLNIEQYLKMINKTEEDMRNEFKEQAERAVKSRLVLEAVAKAEKIENSEEEIAEKIKEMAKNYGKKEEEVLKNEQLRKYVEENMKTEKAIKFIVDNAKIK